MLKTEENIKASVDWLVVAVYFILVFCGWFSIYGASYEYDHATSIFDLSTRAGSQLIWIGTSAVLAFILLKLDSNLYDVFAYFIYAFFILLLLLTVFIAPDIKGSRSWLVITNSIRIQPAEFAKFAVALALARFMNGYNFKLMKPKSLLIIAALIGLPMVLILLQKETGSALVYTSFILVLYREGLPGISLILIVCSVFLFVVGLKFSDVDLGLITQGELICFIFLILVSACLLIGYRKDYKNAGILVLGLILIYGITFLLTAFTINIDWGYIAIATIVLAIGFLIFLAKKYWSKTYLFIALFILCGIGFVSSVDYVFSDVLQPHQQMRIKVSLGMEDDPMGAGYNVNQSKIAIGSGGFAGKGFLNGTQTKLKYVPEQDTDFIFCTVGEEHGFVGSVLILSLFLTLILRLIYLAERQKNTFGRVYGYSVASIFLFHLTINIGMVIGILPVIGIPLPFFSYGGSSMWGFTILLFIFLRLDMSRKRR